MTPANRTVRKMLAVTCADRPGRRYLDLSIDPAYDYKVSFVQDDNVLSSVALGAVRRKCASPGWRGSPWMSRRARSTRDSIRS